MIFPIQLIVNSRLGKWLKGEGIWNPAIMEEAKPVLPKTPEFLCAIDEYAHISDEKMNAFFRQIGKNNKASNILVKTEKGFKTLCFSCVIGDNEEEWINSGCPVCTCRS